MNDSVTKQLRSIRRNRIVLRATVIGLVGAAFLSKFLEYQSVWLFVFILMFLVFIIIPIIVINIHAVCPNCKKEFFGGLITSGFNLNNNSCKHCGININGEESHKT